MSLQNFEKMTAGMFERSFSEVRRQFERLKRTAAEKRLDEGSSLAGPCDHNIIENRRNMCISAEMRQCISPEDAKKLQITDACRTCCSIPDDRPVAHKKERSAARSARRVQPPQQGKRVRRRVGAKKGMFTGQRIAAENGASQLQHGPVTEECPRVDTWSAGEDYMCRARAEDTVAQRHSTGVSDDALCAQVQLCSRPKRLSIKLKNTQTRPSESAGRDLGSKDSMLHIECREDCGVGTAPGGAWESVEAMSTSIIASIGGLSSLNFLDVGNLNENFSVSMHEIQTQDVAIMSPPPARKRSLSIRKSSICNIIPARPPARKKKPASPPPEEALGNIEIVDILMEICIKKVSFDDLKLEGVVKCGEATFSEVFRADDLIYKVVPIGDGCTDMDAFCRESYIFSKLSGEEGVCALKSVFVTTGRYPKKLLDAWDRYKREFGSESERPTKYTKSQKFGVIVMENSGQDLEKYVFREKTDVKAFLRQFIECVARLERKYEFEHRDLHWGNVMIDDTGGLRMRIIDFSLSRMKDGSLVYMDLSKKPWLFEGDESEDEQFGVYKEMKIFCGNDWSRFTPMSNVLWIRYVVNKVEKKARRFSLKTFMKSLKLGIDSAVDAVGLHSSTSGLW